MEVIIRDVVSGRVLFHDNNFRIESLNYVRSRSEIEDEVWDLALDMGLVTPEQRSNCSIETLGD